MKKNVIERKIMWGDLDPLGIVFYPRYSEWIDGCSHLFFDGIGHNLIGNWEKRKLLFGLVNVTSDFMNPGRYFDDIRITTEIHEVGKKTVTLKHTIENAADGKVMVQCYEKRICLNAENPRELKAMDIPDDIAEAFRKLT